MKFIIIQSLIKVPSNYIYNMFASELEVTKDDDTPTFNHNILKFKISSLFIAYIHQRKKICDST